MLRKSILLKQKPLSGTSPKEAKKILENSGHHYRARYNKFSEKFREWKRVNKIPGRAWKELFHRALDEADKRHLNLREFVKFLPEVAEKAGISFLPLNIVSAGGPWVELLDQQYYTFLNDFPYTKYDVKFSMSDNGRTMTKIFDRGKTSVRRLMSKIKFKSVTIAGYKFKLFKSPFFHYYVREKNGAYILKKFTSIKQLISTRKFYDINKLKQAIAEEWNTKTRSMSGRFQEFFSMYPKGYLRRFYQESPLPQYGISMDKDQIHIKVHLDDRGDGDFNKYAIGPQIIKKIPTEKELKVIPMTPEEKLARSKLGKKRTKEQKKADKAAEKKKAKEAKEAANEASVKGSQQHRIVLEKQKLELIEQATAIYKLYAADKIKKAEYVKALAEIQKKEYSIQLQLDKIVD